jgi:hypothetical protein
MKFSIGEDCGMVPFRWSRRRWGQTRGTSFFVLSASERKISG